VRSGVLCPVLGSHHQLVDGGLQALQTLLTVFPQRQVGATVIALPRWRKHFFAGCSAHW